MNKFLKTYYALTKNSENEFCFRNYFCISLALFFYFITFSLVFTLFPIWLKDIANLNPFEEGIVFSINSITALAIQPLYGYIQDRLILRKHLLYITAVFLIFVGPFMLHLYPDLLAVNIYLGSIIGGCYFGFAFLAGMGILESYTERLGRFCDFEFGRVRMWGSIGWALASMVSGYFFVKNPDINFYLAILTGLLFFVAIVFIKSPADYEKTVQSQEKVCINDVFNLLMNRQFWAFVLYAFGVTCIYNVYDQQFPVFYTSFFQSVEMGDLMYGYLNGAQALLEAGFLFLAPFLVNRIGAKNSLILSGVIMAARIIWSGLASNTIDISIVKLLHALEFPILIVAIFKYIADVFDKRLTVTIYLIGYQFIVNLGSVFLSATFGIFYNSLGFQKSYLIIGLILLCFVALSTLLLTKTKRHQIAKKS